MSFFKNIKNKLFIANNNSIIHNKFILYFILFLSLADLLILTVEQDFVSITIFFLVGLLTTYFSKNMLIILFIALTFTNIIKYGTKIRSEGFEEADEYDVKENRDKDGEEVLLSSDSNEEEKEKPKKKEEKPKKKEEKLEKKEEKPKKKEDEVKSDKYKDNVISKSDDITMEDARALFNKITKIANALK